MTSSSNSSKPGAKASVGLGRAVVMAVISSIATSALCYVALAHYFPQPVPSKAPKTPVALKLDPVVKAPAPKPNAAADTSHPVDLPQAQDAAASVVSVIQTLRDTTGEAYVGPKAHQTLDGNLKTLQTAATRIAQDDATNPAKTAKDLKSFIAALDSVIAKCNEISQRDYETATDVAITQQIASALGNIRTSLP